jgi:hypothetical protein
MFEFVLDSIFVTENDTGLVQFSAAKRLADTQGNYNGNFTALRPPNPPTDPAIRLGPVVPVKDGINPNILLVQTRDAILIWGPPPSAEKIPPICAHHELYIGTGERWRKRLGLSRLGRYHF